MKQGNLNIKIDYKAFDTYKRVVFISGSVRQTYNANKKQYEPDRRIDPCILKIECGVNDVHGIVKGLVNKDLVDVVWEYSDKDGRFITITDTNNEFKIGKLEDKGQITVLKNFADTETTTLTFKARFFDTKSKRVCNFQESFLFTTLATAEAPILVEKSAPVGYVLYPTEQNQGLICQANLAQGKDRVPAAYYWYIQGREITDTNGYKGSKTTKLSVSASNILKEGSTIVCEMADCSKDLAEMIAKDPSITSLPEGYRPSVKPSKTYKAEFMLIKRLPVYDEVVLYPDVVSPEAKSVQVQMVLNTNNGAINNPESLFSIGWLKQSNGTFKYKGFKVNILMEDIIKLNTEGKQLDYELREDLTLK